MCVHELSVVSAREGVFINIFFLSFFEVFLLHHCTLCLFSHVRRVYNAKSKIVYTMEVFLAYTCAKNRTIIIRVLFVCTTDRNYQ